MDDVLMALMGAEDFKELKKVQDTDEYYNIQNLQRVLNTIKPVTNQAARAIMYQADTALDKAHARVATLTPGKTSVEEIIDNDIKKVRGRLDWHRERIPKESASKGQEKVFYEHADDLKKWATEGFIVYNRSLQGKITEGDRSYFKEVMQTLAEYAKKGKETFEKATSWVPWFVGGTVVAIGTYAWYQMKMAKIKSGTKEEV